MFNLKLYDMIYRLTEKEKKQVSSNLQYDLINGMYDSFPKLKSRLEYISNKLINHIYISNREDLSYKEYETLAENRYFENLQS